MSALPKLYDQPNAKEARLRELGVAEEILLQAAERGLSAFAACTPNDPKNFPPLASWAATIRGLGDLLAPSGSIRIDENGQPLILNAQGTIAITVAGADKNTGLNGTAQPRTSSSKGFTTLRAMAANRYLFPEMEQDAVERFDSAKRRETWFLLIHRDMLAEEMRCELSLPVSMGEDRHIDGWAERIPLKPTKFDSALLIGIPDESGRVTDEITVEIKRRA